VASWEKKIPGIRIAYEQGQKNFCDTENHRKEPMSIIPDPSELVELARSAQRNIEDREWKQYQRYLSKFEDKNGHSSRAEPLSFKEYCEKLGNSGEDKNRLESKA
jgi:hypothetical protein